MRPILIIAVMLLVRSMPAAACPVPGERMHWVADYCMAQLGTDDEIAASDCIGEQQKISHENDCAAKTHYKTLMCQAAIERGDLRDDLKHCVADPDFVGYVVRNGGVGGAP